jgi:hypothetical protein
MKKEATVLALKLRDGTDILGLYAGEVDHEITNEPCVIMFRPVRIILQSMIVNGRIISNYIPSMYFPYGDVSTYIPKNQIVHQEIANDFFTRFYTKVLGELIVYEENRQERIMNVFDAQELEEIMQTTNSMYVNQETAYKQ